MAVENANNSPSTLSSCPTYKVEDNEVVKNFWCVRLKASSGDFQRQKIKSYIEHRSEYLPRISFEEKFQLVRWFQYLWWYCGKKIYLLLNAAYLTGGCVEGTGISAVNSRDLFRRQMIDGGCGSGNSSGGFRRELPGGTNKRWSDEALHFRIRMFQVSPTLWTSYGWDIGLVARWEKIK